MPTEFAYFTPTEITGSGHWIDFWNADLFWGQSHAEQVFRNGQVLFRRDATTWRHDFRVGGANGVVQAAFNLPRDDHVLAVVKLSSSGAFFQVYMDTTFVGFGTVLTTGQVFPFLMSVKAGNHSFTLLQGPFQVLPKDHLWFHSLTLFSF